jgi:hypothetical protein
MGAYMWQADLEQQYEEKTREIAGEIVTAVHTQRATRPSFLSMMTFKIQQAYWKKPPEDPNESYDYEYWRRNGWIDPQRDFYIWHKSSWVKAVLARMSGALLARFVV